MVSALRLSVMEFSFLILFPISVVFLNQSRFKRSWNWVWYPDFTASSGYGEEEMADTTTGLTLYLRYKAFSSTPVARYSRRFCLPKLTSPVYTQFSAALPLTWPLPFCKENFMWLRFLLLKNVPLSPVLFAVILVLLWVPKCCNWNCKARRKVSIVFVTDQLISKKLSLSPRSVDLSY